jgi:hypothetical protein
MANSAKTSIQEKNKVAKTKPQKRQNLSLKTKIIVLTEAGYRCAVPTCREILLLDIHHMDQVSNGGGNEPDNLIALCPNCHAMYHRGSISSESIYAWKAMLIAIGRAFDVQTIDKLMFLDLIPKDELIVSGDGLLHFDRVIAANFATFEQIANNNNQLVNYSVNISAKGKMMINAWKNGKLDDIKKSLSGN